jgi:hypothetical protein
MNGWKEALLTYGLTIVISLGIACIIFLMVALSEKFSKKKEG